MTITEQSRLNLYESMREHHGEEVAVTLMEMLPPVGWADIATKTDLEHLRVATKTDIEHLRVATKTDIEHLRVATKTDIENLRVATKTDLEHLRSEITLSFRAELEHALRRQGQWMVATIFAAQVVLVGAMKLL